MHVGLIGEDPNDTIAVKALLAQAHPNRNLSFCPLVRKQRGCQLDSDAFQRKLDAELSSTRKRFDLLIYIRDLDSLKNTKEIKKKVNWFNRLNKQFGGTGLFLLNIYELEALILADITIFNTEYRTSIRFVGSPSSIEKPKEYLMEKTRRSIKRYKESDCPELFKKLRIAIIENNCDYFAEFMREYRQRIA